MRLSEFGPPTIDMPATPLKIWSAIHQAIENGAAGDAAS